MKERKRSGWIQRFLLGLVLVLGVLGMRTSVQAASVVKSTEDYTLYSDGKLVVHNADVLYNGSGGAPKCKDILETVPIKVSGVQGELFVNPDVTSIVIESKMTVYDYVLWSFPNVRNIVWQNPSDFPDVDDFDGLFAFISFGGATFDDDDTYAYNYVKAVVDYWNSHYYSKLTMEKMEIPETWKKTTGYNETYIWKYYHEPTKNICMTSYDIGNVKEQVLKAGYSFKALTCKLDSSNGSSLGTVGSVVFDGKAHGAEIEEGIQVGCENGHVLNSGKQCTISYYNQRTKKTGDTTSAGTVKVTVKGINGHTGTLTGTYTIKPQTLKKGNVSLSKASYTYDGKAKKPGVTVKNSAGKTLKAKTDYTVSYSGNVNAGTATVTIKGKGNYTGTVKKTFKIAKAKQTISLKTAKKAFQQTALAKKSASFSIGASAKTKLTYKSSGKKYVTVTSKGKVTVKKGTPRGTYTVTVTAAATKNYKSAVKTVKVTVK